MTGRRVQSIAEIEQPGGYCGPVTGYTAGLPAVFFDEGHVWRQV